MISRLHALCITVARTRVAALGNKG